MNRYWVNARLWIEGNVLDRPFPAGALAYIIGYRQYLWHKDFAQGWEQARRDCVGGKDRPQFREPTTYILGAGPKNSSL